jgi:hypothetical protein
VRGLVLIASAGLGAREPLLFRVARWPILGAIATGLRGRGFTARLLRSTYADPGKVTDSDVDQYYAPVARAGYGDALRGVLREFRFDGLEGGGAVSNTSPVLRWCSGATRIGGCRWRWGARWRPGYPARRW